MESQASQSGERPGELPSTLVRSALLLDLEASMRGTILKAGAVLADKTFAQPGGSSTDGILTGLCSLVNGAHCVLGHNLIRHDLEMIREIAPTHPLLRLPVIDTLILSPIVFPENPYHRLVKDYKLVRESLNDPVADARQAASVFEDEFTSLDGLRQTEPALFELLHFLLAIPRRPLPIQFSAGRRTWVIS